MSSIQDIYQLPENIQKEVLDFMSYVAEKNGVHLREDKSGRTGHKWLKKVDRPVNTSGELISDTVRRLRDEEKW